MKWIWLSMFKMLGPSVAAASRPATFVSVAGPGGIAEIGDDVAGVPTVVVVPESPAAAREDEPAVLLVRIIQEETPGEVASVVEADAPEVVETEDEALRRVDEAPTTFQPPAEITPPTEPDLPSVNVDEAPTTRMGTARMTTAITAKTMIKAKTRTAKRKIVTEDES